MTPKIKYPPFDLQLSDAVLHLHVVTDSDLAHMCAVTEEDVFEPGCPWVFPWIQADDRALSTAQFQWGLRANNKPTDWKLSFAAYLDGEFIGSIDMRAEQFQKRRCIETGSYLLRRFQGQGLGKRMRAIVAAYAFDYLGAREMRTAWHELNKASGGVSKALGYEVVGHTAFGEDDRPEVHARLVPENFIGCPNLNVAGHTPELMSFLDAHSTR
ncbi:GNAT family N-acetyltransferase [Corynebacterium hindlerae]|uniref:GNAT family N-acetyltransferase n=1 Tax=Corynebacterium hindlerae TaxID=699041 RepID=UPI0031B6F431